MKKAQELLLVLCFFVSPLIFFTNLTRNPYVTQIVILNIALLLSGALVLAQAATDKGLPWPKTPMNAPLYGLAFAAVLSFVVGYFGHAAFYRPAIISQGATAFLFLGANTLLPFYLSAVLFFSARRDDADVNLWPWVIFILIWSALWFGFPALRGPRAGDTDIWGQFWGAYGALLWAGGIAGAFWLCRKNRWIDYLHLALTAGFVASVYGVIQYFNMEFIWPYALNPYGGRSVSTFGNPNFLSSFNVVLLPIAAVLCVQSKGFKRIVYGIAALALEAALLCSLTRSSWLGAAVAFGVLLLSSDVRQSISKNPRPYGLFFGLGAAMAIFWPESSIATGYRLSAAGRFIELGKALAAHKDYSPLYQRVLIWSSAWLMGKENALTGQGYGLFELFYPFYQGPILLAVDFFRTLRTHANNAHNEILEYWSQMGILGVGVLFWMWTAFFSAAKAHFKSRRKEDWIFVACAAGIAGMLVDNLLNVSLHFAVPAFLFWWIAGLTMAAASLPPDGGEPRRVALNFPWKRALAGVLAAAFCATSWYWVKTWNREAHYFSGFKLNRISETSEAIKELETARSWGPREVNMLYELGNSYAQAQRYADARQTYFEALDANAGYDEIYYNIGAVDNAHLGLTDEAVKFLRASLFINPLSSVAYTALTDIYLKDPKKYWNPAIAVLKQATSVDPLNLDYWNNLGYLYAVRGRFAQAETAYAQALSINPGLQIARHNLTMLVQQAHFPRPPILAGLDMLDALQRRLARKDMSDATLALARKTADLIPNAAAPKFYLGSLLLARGRAADAIGPLEWVVQNAPRNESAWLNLAAAYQSAGRPSDAMDAWRRVLAMDPGNKIARQEIGVLQNIFK